MKRALALALLLGVSPLPAAQPGAQPAAPAAPKSFELTVDGIMRGPLLVGYPPEELRWSGDSRELFFEWRLASEDEAATWVVIPGQRPRRLTDEERKIAPATEGSWDAAGRRIVFVDKGDIVVVDTVARSRTQVTRTAAAEANPRWARRDTAITFTRDNGLYVVPFGGGPDIVVQLVDAGPAKAEPRLTEAQKFLRDEEQKLLKAVREAAEKRKKEEEEKKKAAPPRYEITDKQSVRGRDAGARRPARVPPRRRQGRRSPGRRRADLRDRVGLCRDQGRADQGRRRPGAAPAGGDGPADGEERLGQRGVRGTRPRAEAGAVSVARAFTRAVPYRRRQAPTRPRPRPRKRSTARCAGRCRSSPATAATRWLPCGRPTTRTAGSSPSIPPPATPACWTTSTTTRGSGTWGPAPTASPTSASSPTGRRCTSRPSARAGCTSTPSTPGGGAARALTSGAWEVSAVDLAPAKKTFLLTTTEAHPGERHVYTMPIEGGAADAAHHRRRLQRRACSRRTSARWASCAPLRIARRRSSWPPPVRARR